jgi:hypothetical protein
MCHKERLKDFEVSSNAVDRAMTVPPIDLSDPASARQIASSPDAGGSDARAIGEHSVRISPLGPTLVPRRQGEDAPTSLTDFASENSAELRTVQPPLNCERHDVSRPTETRPVFQDTDPASPSPLRISGSQRVLHGHRCGIPGGLRLIALDH